MIMMIYLLRRLGQSVLVMFAVAALVFVAVYIIGDPVDVLSNPTASDEERAAVTVRLGLDRPLYEQFFIFLKNAAQGDLGQSFVFNRPALEVVLSHLPVTLELAFVGLLFSLFISLPLGIVAGLKSETWVGRSIMSGSIFGFSLPNFWIGLMLISLFAIKLKWLPAGGRGQTTEFMGLQLALLSWGGLKHLLLPALTLSLYKAALIIRIVEAGTREVMVQDYIRFARAKGLSRGRIVFLHMLKNIMIPVVTVLGLELGSMIAFAVVTETVFSYPGMGKLLIDSIIRLDRPVIVAYMMLTVMIFVLINLVVDLLYALLDPRVRLTEARS